MDGYMFLYSTLPLIKVYIPIKCHAKICSTQNLSMKKQRAITLPLGMDGYMFLCSTLPLIKVYIPIKWHADIFCSHWNMFHTQFKYDTKQRVLTIQLGGGLLWFFCSALFHNEIYTPRKFHVEICNSLWDIAPTSLWRTDGYPDIRTDGQTNSRTDNAKSTCICLRLWRGIITFNGDVADLRCYRYGATIRMFVYDVGGYIQAPRSHGIWDVD